MFYDPSLAYYCRFTCLICFGCFVVSADLAYIITDYRADVDRQWRDGSIRELTETKNEKLAAEQRPVSAEKREVEYVAELKRLKVESEKIKEATKSSTDELDKLRVQAVEDKKKIDSLGAEMLEMKGTNEARS